MKRNKSEEHDENQKIKKINEKKKYKILINYL